MPARPTAYFGTLDDPKVPSQALRSHLEGIGLHHHFSICHHSQALVPYTHFFPYGMLLVKLARRYPSSPSIHPITPSQISAADFLAT